MLDAETFQRILIALQEQRKCTREVCLRIKSTLRRAWRNENSNRHHFLNAFNIF